MKSSQEISRFGLRIELQSNVSETDSAIIRADVMTDMTSLHSVAVKASYLK
jgi:hypothetical protein